MLQIILTAINLSILGFWLITIYRLKRKSKKLKQEISQKTSDIQAEFRRAIDLIKKNEMIIPGPTLMFDHEPTQAEIDTEIAKLSRTLDPSIIESFGPMASELKTGQPIMPSDRKAAINADFEASDIFKSLKNLDNE